VSRQNIMRIVPHAAVPHRDDLAAYWRAVATDALPHVVRRPLTLVRSVNGLTFFHKGPLPPVPAAVHQLPITKSQGEPGVRVWIDDLRGLLALIEMDVVEIHPWQSTVDDIEAADLLVFDLDPGEGIPWPFVCETALALRDMLQDNGFDVWAKTSGSKGLHIMVPLPQTRSWPEVRRMAQTLMARFAARDARYTISSAVAGRRGKLFLDYLRNGRGNTAVGTYCPRMRPGFPVSCPVRWTDVARGIAPDAITMADLIAAKRRPSRRQR
jgi:bifunctional non-homologous end joining protein LigD